MTSDDPRERAIAGDAVFEKLYLQAAHEIGAAEWHWLQYLFSFLPPHPVAARIVECACECEDHLAGLGATFLSQIARLGGRNRNTDDYQAILQVMAEMLVLARAFRLEWPGKPEFLYEPRGRQGKRPELLIRSGGRRFMLEVKAPSLHSHQRQRSQNGFQVPGRMPAPEMVERLARGEPVTMPRDNPVKDFLVSAEGKFADFDDEDGANILVIVWDDHIYEPITTLSNERTGLLTENSYLTDDEGRPKQFPHVDAIIVIRHLTYFQQGLGERPLPDRQHLFDFGGDRDLPNVIFPTPWGRPVPAFIADGFRALDYREPILERVAEYHPQEFIMWIGV